MFFIIVSIGGLVKSKKLHQKYIKFCDEKENPALKNSTGF